MPRGRRNIRPNTLKATLENYTIPNLKKLAGLLEKGLPTRKAELVDLLLRHLEDSQHLRELWNALDTLGQAAVAEVVHAPSCTFNASEFSAKYKCDPDWGTRRWSDFEAPSLLCLFIYNSEMPKDLQGSLKAFVPPPRAVQIETVSSPPPTVPQQWYDYQAEKKRTADIPVELCETERAALHDLQAVLRLIDAGKVRVSAKTHRATATGVRAITPVLLGGDFYAPDEKLDDWHDDKIGPIKAFAWPLILQSAGLVELAGTKLQLTAKGKKAFTGSPHRIVRNAWKRWLKTTLLDEFNRVHTIKGQGGKGKRKMTAASGRRATIADVLAQCPVHQWISLDEFWRFMRASGQTFQITRDLWSLYISDPTYGSLGYSGFGDWHIIQGRYILAFLFEYAATLGLVDIAYIHPSQARNDYRNLWGVDDLACLSRYDGLLYLRINALGAWCLGITETYALTPFEAKPAFEVLPNLEIVVTEILSPNDVLFLKQIAEQKSDFVWQINQPKLLEAVEQGHAVSSITEFLEAKSRHSLPGTVTILFNQVADRTTCLAERGPALLIEAQDATLAQLIANDGRTRALCMLAGERFLVAPLGSERAFRRALRELGYGLPPAQ